VLDGEGGRDAVYLVDGVHVRGRHVEGLLQVVGRQDRVFVLLGRRLVGEQVVRRLLLAQVLAHGDAIVLLVRVLVAALQGVLSLLLNLLQRLRLHLRRGHLRNSGLVLDSAVQLVQGLIWRHVVEQLAVFEVHQLLWGFGAVGCVLDGLWVRPQSELAVTVHAVLHACKHVVAS